MCGKAAHNILCFIQSLMSVLRPWLYQSLWWIDKWSKLNNIEKWTELLIKTEREFCNLCVLCLCRYCWSTRIWRSLLVVGASTFQTIFVLLQGEFHSTNSFFLKTKWKSLWAQVCKTSFYMLDWLIWVLDRWFTYFGSLRSLLCLNIQIKQLLWRWWHYMPFRC